MACSYLTLLTHKRSSLSRRPSLGVLTHGLRRSCTPRASYGNGGGSKPMPRQLALDLDLAARNVRVSSISKGRHATSLSPVERAEADIYHVRARNVRSRRPRPLADTAFLCVASATGNLRGFARNPLAALHTRVVAERRCACAGTVDQSGLGRGPG